MLAKLWGDVLSFAPVEPLLLAAMADAAPFSQFLPGGHNSTALSLERIAQHFQLSQTFTAGIETGSLLPATAEPFPEYHLRSRPSAPVMPNLSWHVSHPSELYCISVTTS